MIEVRLVRHHLTPILTDRARGMRDEVAEAKLWYFLCNRRLNGFRFRRDRPTGPFAAQFYCFEAKLLVDLVTDAQSSQIEDDAARAHWIHLTGHRLLRINSREVHQHLVTVLGTILQNCCERTGA